jgi:hypothetical protein
MKRLKILTAFVICLNFISCNSNMKAKSKNETRANKQHFQQDFKKTYTIALKDCLIKKWTLEKEKDPEIGEILIKDNVLTINSIDGYALSTYDFSDLEITKNEKSKKTEITVYNQDGGGGGNMVLVETYSLTEIDSGAFLIKNKKTELLK